MAGNFFGYPPAPPTHQYGNPGPPPPYEAPNQAPFQFGSGNQPQGFNGPRPGFFQGPPRGPAPPPPPGTGWHPARSAGSMRGGRGRGGRWGRGGGGGRGGWFGLNHGGGDAVLPKPQTLHYCDVCRVSCAGSQTYEEHINGAKHKKKEAAAKAGAAAALPPGSSALHCELCDVTCTGSDAYAAHIRGLKHQRVVKLHQKLGKPIPSHEPTVISNRKDEAQIFATAPAGGSDDSATDGVKLALSDNVQVVEAFDGAKVAVPKLPTETDLEPVGVNFVEEIKEGAKVGYKCTLCECQLNDHNARDMHLKGRRHRLQYKKTVDPSIVVPKPGGHRRDIDHIRDDIGQGFMPPWNAGPRPPFPPGPPVPGFFGHPFEMDNAPMPFPTINDRFIMGKYNDLILKPSGRKVLFSAVLHVEQALRGVSERLSTAATAENGSTDAKPFLIMNVLRVGDMIDNLLMSEAPRANLMLICDVKPTKLHREQVLELMPKELAKMPGCEDKYSVTSDNAAGFEVFPKDNPSIRVSVTMTSPRMRPENLQAAGENRRSEEDTKGSEGGDSAASATPADPPDVLDKDKCLEALAQLRHSKWFQARLSASQPCVATILILRDMKNRWPAWDALTPWAIELLVHAARSSIVFRVAPADVFKRVIEMVAGGIFLPGMGQPLVDPCERDFTDAVGLLTDTQRQELTDNAQKLLRMICFRQLNKILGIEKREKTAKRAPAEEAKPVNGSEADFSAEKKMKTEPDAEALAKPMDAEADSSAEKKIKTEPDAEAPAKPTDAEADSSAEKKIKTEPDAEAPAKPMDAEADSSAAMKIKIEPDADAPAEPMDAKEAFA